MKAVTNMRENQPANKSLAFSLRIVKLNQYLSFCHNAAFGSESRR